VGLARRPARRQDAHQRCANGGGEEHEGEDIIVLEMSLDEAFALIASGEIVDLKTIALLQAAKLEK